MIYDFTFNNPTRIHFGKNAMRHMAKELNNYGDNILLLYGKKSIKKIGLYDEVMGILSECGKHVSELSGIKPNPSYSQVLEGAKIVREKNIDLILAVGGGSVIDCAKAISVSAYTEGDPWQKYWVDFKPLDSKVVPVASVLTMVGTGSEMNAGSVITNEDTMIKEGRVFTPEVNPKFSILNPEYTYSVPKIQMVSGIFDIMSHLCEQYFSGDDDAVVKRAAESGELKGKYVFVKTVCGHAWVEEESLRSQKTLLPCYVVAINMQVEELSIVEEKGHYVARRNHNTLFPINGLVNEIISGLEKRELQLKIDESGYGLEFNKNTEESSEDFLKNNLSGKS